MIKGSAVRRADYPVDDGASSMRAATPSTGRRVEAMAAVGEPGDREALPERLRERKAPNGRRKLSETVCEGPFCF